MHTHRHEHHHVGWRCRGPRHRRTTSARWWRSWIRQPREPSSSSVATAPPVRRSTRASGHAIRTASTSLRLCSVSSQRDVLGARSPTGPTLFRSTSRAASSRRSTSVLTGTTHVEDRPRRSVLHAAWSHALRQVDDRQNDQDEDEYPASDVHVMAPCNRYTARHIPPCHGAETRREGSNTSRCDPRGGATIGTWCGLEPMSCCSVSGPAWRSSRKRLLTDTTSRHGSRRPATSAGCGRSTRPLTYRAIDQLTQRGLIVRRRRGARQGRRQAHDLLADPAGRKLVRRWLQAPVPHFRAVRDELLLKLVLCSRLGIDPSKLLAAQREVFAADGRRARDIRRRS